MEVEPLTPAGHAEWNAFCVAEPAAWLWHTTEWMDYLRAARPERGPRSLAFAVRDGGALAAVVPAAVEDGPDGPELAAGGAPLWAPAVAANADADAVLRVALDHLDALAAEHGAVRAALQVSPLVAERDVAVAALRAGWLDVSRASQVLDLAPGPEALRASMSKGHRAAVARAGRLLDVALAADREAVDAFGALYAAASGRPGAPATYAALARWLERGDGLLALARHEGVVVGGTYVVRHHDGAYYFSSAMDRALSALPIGHGLQWALIERLAADGVARYELGLQQLGPLPHDLGSEKERNISRFKRGFGGRPRLVAGREKWYDREVAARVLAARAVAYSEALIA